MNAERLLALYERVAEAPDAIARLRRFILDLAVRGKLVPQDPNDEPASELLKRIAQEKAQLDRKERIKREPKIFHADPDPMQMPQGWALALLADLVTVLNGRAYKQNELLSAGTPVLRVGNLFTSDKWYYSALQLDEDKYCKKGDLIFAWSASFGPFIWDGARVIYHYHIWKLPLHSEADLNKLFLYNFLLQKTREIKEAGHGISMIHMTKEKMEKLVVPLPPLAEQHRIVAKVDELMALCDRLEAARQEREARRDRLAAASLARLNAPDPETFQSDARFALDALPALTTRPNQIKQLRQTILNLAVRGRLLPQDPQDEPASELLKRIAREKTRASKRERTNAEIDNEEEIGELPATWRAVPLIALGSWAIGSGFPKNEQGSESGQYFFLKVSDMNLPGNEKYIATSNNSIDDEAARRMRANIHPAGTIIFPKIGGAIATNKRRILTRGSAIDNNCLGITFASELNLEWAFLLLTTLDFTRYQAGTAVPALQQGVLERIPVGLPPLAEQHRIVAKVDELMALCSRLEASLTTSNQTRTRLLEATLAEALAPASVSEIEVVK